MGVASWSPAQVNGAECAGISVFSRVTTYLPWIKDMVTSPRKLRDYLERNGAAGGGAAAYLITVAVLVPAVN